MTELIKEFDKKIMLMIDRDEATHKTDYFLSVRANPVVYFSESEIKGTDLFLERTIKYYDPDTFMDCLDFFTTEFFKKRPEIESVSMVKILDEGIRQKLASRGIIENQNRQYIIQRPPEELKMGRVR